MVKSVDTLLAAPLYIAAYKEALAAHRTPPPELSAQMGAIQAASAAAPGEWRTWYMVCIVCVVVFIATIFVMRGRWSPTLARADEAAHDADVAHELASLQSRSEA